MDGDAELGQLGLGVGVVADDGSVAAAGVVGQPAGCTPPAPIAPEEGSEAAPVVPVAGLNVPEVDAGLLAVPVFG